MCLTICSVFTQKNSSVFEIREKQRSRCWSDTGRKDHEHCFGVFLLSIPYPPPSSGIQLWVLMLQEGTSSLQSYWAKARMRHERSMWVKPGRTWETLLENDWIREYFKIKACNQPRPRSRRGSCMLYDSSMTALSQGTAGPHPACTSHLQFGPRCTYMP